MGHVVPGGAQSTRLVVLGAGATRGAKLIASETGCQPPLNADFFGQIQRITGSKYRALVRDVVADIVELFGSNFTLTLEEYFTQLEFLNAALAIAPQKAGPITPSEIRRKRDRLHHAISAVLEMSTDASIRGASAKGCARHRKLVENLGANDVIVSFNYDCLIDHALKLSGDGKWSAAVGYAFPRPRRVEGADRWNPKSPAPSRKETITLLKLHGSLNWQLPHTDAEPDEDHQKTIYLKERLHGQFGVPHFTIIPPVWNKAAASHPTFKVLWRDAERAIRTATDIAVLGFSFAPTDLPVESLFRLALARRGTKLNSLVIANKSAHDRRRTRKVFAKPLEKGTIVRQYDDFERFVDALPGCF